MRREVAAREASARRETEAASRAAQRARAQEEAARKALQESIVEAALKTIDAFRKQIPSSEMKAGRLVTVLNVSASNDLVSRIGTALSKTNDVELIKRFQNLQASIPLIPDNFSAEPRLFEGWLEQRLAPLRASLKELEEPFRTQPGD